ncbi:TPA: hypothetical protein EYM82_19020 [Candidatus Poribacteria bacterium]|nr:hypothetical protein [Candidatus Poribacteria bacterium]
MKDTTRKSSNLRHSNFLTLTQQLSLKTLAFLVISSTYLFPFHTIALICGTPDLRASNLWNIPPVDLPSSPAQKQVLKVGDQVSFYAIDFRNYNQYRTKATLRTIGDFCYIFVEDSQWQLTITAKVVQNLNRVFEKLTLSDGNRGIYQIETQAFGHPPNIDNDDRIYILLLDIPDRFRFQGEFIGGYFNPIDQAHGKLIHPQLQKQMWSNERDIIYIDTDPLNVGSNEGFGTVAHEFQHLIHWRHDQNEEIWVNEGISEYAMLLCGYSSVEHLQAFGQKPNTSLTNWPADGQNQLPSYGATYLWILYLDEHYGGTSFVSSLVKNRSVGISGINQVLQLHGFRQSFSSVFSDWKVANYLDDEIFDQGRFGYRKINIKVKTHRKHRSYPIHVTGDRLEGYATHYLEFSNFRIGQQISFDFESRGRFPFDIRTIELARGRPINVNNLQLSNSGRGNQILPSTDEMADTVVVVPSLEELTNVLGKSISPYDYRAEVDREVMTQTFVLKNPIHSRYWEILMVLSKKILSETPQISVLTDQKLLVSKTPMQQIQDNYVYQLYLPPRMAPNTILWQIYYLDRQISAGNLNSQ